MILCLAGWLLGCSKWIDLNPVYFLTGENLLVKRSSVAKGRIRVIGKSTQQITDLLGEPNATHADSEKGMELWEFIYYKPATHEISGEKRTFRITFHHERVVEIQSPELTGRERR